MIPGATRRPRPSVSTLLIIAYWGWLWKEWELLESVENSTAILAIFHGCRVCILLRGGSWETHEATEADAPLNRDHHPCIPTAHPLVHLEKPIVDLFREPLSRPFQLFHSVQRENQLLFAVRALRVLGFPNH